MQKINKMNRTLTQIHDEIKEEEKKKLSRNH